MMVLVKILGHRNGLTQAKRSDGSRVYLDGTVGTAGEQEQVNTSINYADRTHPRWKQLHERFFKV